MSAAVPHQQVVSICCLLTSVTEGQHTQKGWAPAVTYGLCVGHHRLVMMKLMLTRRSLCHDVDSVAVRPQCCAVPSLVPSRPIIPINPCRRILWTITPKCLPPSLPASAGLLSSPHGLTSLDSSHERTCEMSTLWPSYASGFFTSYNILGLTTL